MCGMIMYLRFLLARASTLIAASILIAFVHANVALQPVTRVLIVLAIGGSNLEGAIVNIRLGRPLRRTAALRAPENRATRPSPACSVAAALLVVLDVLSMAHGVRPIPRNAVADDGQVLDDFSHGVVEGADSPSLG